MLYLIQRGKVRSQVVNVPEGLPEILTDITREVLRCQPTPECMCQFIIDYLHSVIVTRERARVAKSIIDRALIKVDGIISDLCICDIPKEKSEQMSLAMEECFKRFLAKRRCEKDRQSEVLKFEELDVLDELIRKCKFSEDELKKSRRAIEEAYVKFMDFYLVANTDENATEALYQHFRARELQRQVEKQQTEAAVKIQAYFRGYAIRKSMQDLRRSSAPVPPSFDTHSADDETIIKHDVAARKIQKFFKDRFSRTYERLMKPDDMCEDISKISMIGSSIAKAISTVMPITSSVTVEAQSAKEEEQPTQTEHVAVPEKPTELTASDANIKDFFEEEKFLQMQEKTITPTELTEIEEEESAPDDEIEE
uniref:Uncharacterized protein n=1 Tax=Glossina morsitans morsitans TaxID=37546 RepID=A0A905AWE7_GLOMM